MTFAILLASTLLAGTHAHTIRIGDTDRSYLVHVPPHKAAAKRPLVVLLHGGGGGAQQAEAAYRMSEVADRNGFLVAYPNGSGALRDDILLTWNAGNCCAYALRHNVDDVAFIRAMVERIDRDYGVDRTRVFATGMSNGAMMATASAAKRRTYLRRSHLLPALSTSIASRRTPSQC
jgi:polyhydroxybutyrate depolymerase